MVAPVANLNTLIPGNIRKVFLGVVALDDVDLKLSAGRVHCAIGENGAGKSTLVKIITGGLKADGGAVYIRGEEAAGIFSSGKGIIGFREIFLVEQFQDGI